MTTVGFPGSQFGFRVKQVSWNQDCSWECMDTGFVSYFFTFGEKSLVFKKPNLGQLEKLFAYAGHSPEAFF